MQPQSSTIQPVQIQLTQGKVALIDAIDFERVSQRPWFARQGEWGWYAMTHKRVGENVEIYLHRFVMNAPKNSQVDHIDGDGLNNQKNNLRLCTNYENSGNRGPNKNNTSGYKGVSWRKDTEKWQSNIHVRGKLLYLGVFDTPEEAARAYDRKARELFGEFSKTNF